MRGVTWCVTGVDVISSSVIFLDVVFEQFVVIAQAHQERARRRRRLSSGAPVSAHLSGSARRTEARPVGYRSLASERCFRRSEPRLVVKRRSGAPTRERLGRGFRRFNVARHRDDLRDRDNDDEIVHALAVHRAECADDQLCERGQDCRDLWICHGS